MSLILKKTPRFEKSAKKLAKKYQRFVDDLRVLNQELQQTNINAINLGDNFYKILLKNSSNPKGKSSGFRVVYFFKNNANEIYLLDIFIKSEMSINLLYTY